MRKLFLYAGITSLFAGLPSIVIASDGRPIPLFMLIQFGLFLWPWLIPLLFQQKIHSKWRAYGLMVLWVYGVIGLCHLPLSLYYQLAPWLGLKLMTYSFLLTFLAHGLALVLSLILLSKYSAKLHTLE